MDFSNVSNFSTTVKTQTLFCYESLSGSCTRYARPLTIHVSMFTTMGLAILVTVMGNLLVIISIAHFKQLQTSTNQLLLSLAVCDLLLGVFVMPCSAVRSVQGCWYLGEFMCKLHTSTDIMLSTSSIFHLSFISIDRYLAVCRPMRYKLIISNNTVLIMVATSWLVPAIFAFGMIFSELNLIGWEDFYETHVKCVGGCQVFFSPMTAVVASSFSFFIPGLILICLYFKIYWVARAQAKSIKDLSRQVREADSGRRARRGANILAIVVGVFFACWCPFFLCLIIDPFILYSVPPQLADTLVWFGYLNSTFNPIVYAFFYTWFRRALRIIISGNFFQKDSCRVRLHSE
ncbi:trace amine-associated receptor 1-like [Esox lucius]|uniref:trace amine-associated receptor 1-like n=1 Tax=Esox lucius TaxID=8010 RepID=UPI001476A65B|nr:trace amine-associated receptor 1-like [Esox lucius]